MPKGVEHTSAGRLTNAIKGVESLMPKGVEHDTPKDEQDFKSLCVESLMPKGVEHCNGPFF